MCDRERTLVRSVAWMLVCVWANYGLASDMFLKNLLPANAENVEMREVAEDGVRASQLVFKQRARLRAAPLDTAALEKVTANGWGQCDSPLSIWGNYLDATALPEQRVISSVAFYSKGSQYLQVAAIYRIDPVRGDPKDAEMYSRTVSMT